jgi:hypothetical protein
MHQQPSSPDRFVRNSEGKVIDGREEFLTKIVCREYHRGFKTPDELASRSWACFAAGADVARPKGGRGSRRWAHRDALAKAKQICRKRPEQRRRFVRRRSNPVSHLHSYRRSDYWSADRKAQHQNDAERCAMTPAALAVNRKMLDAIPLAAGQCTVTVRILVGETGFSESAVKSARRKLIEVGLWIAEHGVYVPTPVSEAKTLQCNDSPAEVIHGVQTNVDHLYRSLIHLEPVKEDDPLDVPDFLVRVA